MNKPIKQPSNQDYPELQLVEIEQKSRRQRLQEAYERLHNGLEIIIERRKKSCDT